MLASLIRQHRIRRYQRAVRAASFDFAFGLYLSTLP